MRAPLLVAIALVASCSRPASAPRITRETLAAYLRCSERFDPPEPPGETHAQAVEREARRAALLESDDFARRCGFSSSRELGRLMARVSVAFADAQEERTLAKYPDGFPAEKRAQHLAFWEERRRRGEAVDGEVERKREWIARTDAWLRRMKERRARAVTHPPITLDPRPLTDEGPDERRAVTMGAETPAEEEQMIERSALQKQIVLAESATQPPLSDDERAVVQKHLETAQ